MLLSLHQKVNIEEMHCFGVLAALSVFNIIACLTRGKPLEDWVYFYYKFFFMHLGEKGEAVVGGVGLRGQHCVHTHRHTPAFQARGMQQAQGCDRVQGLCHSPSWPAERGDMVILVPEGVQSSPMFFIHLHACFLGRN